MENTVHEVYSHRYSRNVFKGYGEEGYNACMDFMKRNLERLEFTLEYFRTEPEDRYWDDVEKMLPVGIWKDTTGQYSDEECDEDNMVTIPVPQDLLWQWYMENAEFDREQCADQEPEGGWAEITIEDMLRWLWEEYTLDETDGLYYWLAQHNYYWKRLD